MIKLDKMYWKNSCFMFGLSICIRGGGKNWFASESTCKINWKKCQKWIFQKMVDQVMSRWDSETGLPGGSGSGDVARCHLKAGCHHSNQQPQTSGSTTLSSSKFCAQSVSPEKTAFALTVLHNGGFPWSAWCSREAALLCRRQTSITTQQSLPLVCYTHRGLWDAFRWINSLHAAVNHWAAQWCSSSRRWVLQHSPPVQRLWL